MCMYIGSEVILANLLSFYPKAEQGVDFNTIERYCNGIKKELLNKNSTANFVSFHVNDDELDSSVQIYPRQFKKFMDRYYRGKELDVQEFNSVVKAELNDVLVSVAQML